MMHRTPWGSPHSLHSMVLPSQACQSIETLIVEKELPLWSLKAIQACQHQFELTSLGIWCLLRLFHAQLKEQSALLFDTLNPQRLTPIWQEIFFHIVGPSHSIPSFEWAENQPFCSNNPDKRALFFYSSHRIGLFGMGSMELEIFKRLFEGPAIAPLENADGVKDVYDPKKLLEALISKQRIFLCGGPGSGKSTLISKLVQEYVHAFPESLAGIRLVAPTARAAQRLQSLIAHLPSPRVRDALARAGTVHQLLNLYESQALIGPILTRPRPLLLTFLIVDEASMLSTPLFHQLLLRMPKQAHLLLVGDGHQLPSVEIGGIFQTITAHSSAQPSRALAPYIWELNKTHRFSGETLLAQVTTAMRDKDFAQVLIHSQNSDSSFCWIREWSEKTIQSMILEKYTPYFQTLTAKTPNLEESWAEFSKFRVLVPTNEGPLGTHALNRNIIALLAQQVWSISSHAQRRGIPWMVLKNLKKFGLSNGQIGLGDLKGVQDREESMPLPFIGFPQEEAQSRINYFSLTSFLEGEIAPAFVMSGHKAQGSEFDEILILISENSAPPSSQWLYTALTRAKRRAMLMASETTLQKIFSNSFQKVSFFEEFLTSHFFPEMQKGRF